jgi:hypothetical protein
MVSILWIFWYELYIYTHAALKFNVFSSLVAVDSYILSIIFFFLVLKKFQSLCRYFIYTAKDLEEWSENPESFHHEQNLVQWTEKKRPCAEALFIIIFEKYREVCAFKLFVGAIYIKFCNADIIMCCDSYSLLSLFLSFVKPSLFLRH